MFLAADSIIRAATVAWEPPGATGRRSNVMPGIATRFRPSHHNRRVNYDNAYTRVVLFIVSLFVSLPRGESPGYNGRGARESRVSQRDIPRVERYV